VTDIPLARQRELIRQQWRQDAARLSGAPLPAAPDPVPGQLSPPQAEQLPCPDPAAPAPGSVRRPAHSPAASPVPAAPEPWNAIWQLPGVPEGQREVLRLVRSGRVTPDAVLTSRDPDARALHVGHLLEAASGIAAARATAVMEAAGIGGTAVGDLAPAHAARLLAVLQSRR
jgi:hypothetical protein